MKTAIRRNERRITGEHSFSDFKYKSFRNFTNADEPVLFTMSKVGRLK